MHYILQAHHILVFFVKKKFIVTSSYIYQINLVE